MIVDFLGVSGVGKTTIAKHYYEQEVSAGHKVDWPWRRIYTGSSWIKRNFKKARLVMAFIPRNLGWTEKLAKVLKVDIHISFCNRIKLIFNGAFLKLTIDECADNDTIYLFDEGAFHFVWAAYLRANNKPKAAAITKIVDLFYLPSKVVVIDAATDTIAKRLISRGRDTRILKSRDLKKSIVDNQKRLATIIATITKQYTRVQLEYIWNDEEQLRKDSLIVISDRGNHIDTRNML